jgi:hypothetical protein
MVHPMADLTPVTLAELSKLHEAATPPPWRAGRPDTVSYEGNSNVAYKNVYGPNYEPKLHLGRPVAVDIARGIGELCIANAELIARHA